MDDRTSDDRIMSRVRDGHPEALGVLFERYHVKLLNFFLRMTGNRSRAEDLVQESFVRILRYKDSFQPDRGSFATWMYRLARSVFTDDYRKSIRRRHEELDESGHAAEGPSLQEQAEMSESALILQRCLLKLSKEKREVLVLHRFHFKSFNEIAVILDCSVSSVLRIFRSSRLTRPRSSPSDSWAFPPRRRRPARSRDCSPGAP